jgi:hypothetical protein
MLVQCKECGNVKEVNECGDFKTWIGISASHVKSIFCDLDEVRKLNEFINTRSKDLFNEKVFNIELEVINHSDLRNLSRQAENWIPAEFNVYFRILFDDNRFTSWGYSFNKNKLVDAYLTMTAGIEIPILDLAFINGPNNPYIIDNVSNNRFEIFNEKLEDEWITTITI